MQNLIELLRDENSLIAVLILALYVLYRDFMSPAARKDLREMKSQIEDLHRWHSPDEDGRMTWKLNRDDLNSACKKLAKIDYEFTSMEKSLEKLSRVLEKIVENQQKVVTTLEMMNKDHK